MFTHVSMNCICLLVVIVAVPLLILFTDYSILFSFYTHFHFRCVGLVLLLLLLLRQITSEQAKRLLEINFNVWINNMRCMREKLCDCHVNVCSVWCMCPWIFDKPNVWMNKRNEWMKIKKKCFLSAYFEVLGFRYRTLFKFILVEE